MPIQVYLTEPDSIDARRAQELLAPTGATCTPGDPTFAGASDAYDALLIRSATVVGPDITSHFPNLKHVIRVGTGLDNVDTEFCKANGIAVYNAPGANADAVAEYVACMALYALRRLHLLEPHDIANWNRFKFRGDSVRHATVGVVGFGNIGRLAYEKLRGLGCTSFLVYDPFLPAETIGSYEHVRAAQLDELLGAADVISLHIPLTPATRHTMNVRSLELLKPGAILINTSRGGIVDEAAVIERAQAGKLTYIADTVENEPDINEDLLHQQQIIITPHIASLTADAEAAMLERALHNFLTGHQAKI